MVGKYFVKKLKKSKVQTALSVIAVMIIAIFLCFALAVNGILNSAIEYSARTFSGQSDITIINCPQTNDRFFSRRDLVNALAKNGVTDENSTLHGFFRLTALHGQEAPKIVTVFAGDILTQNLVNPLATPDVPRSMHDGAKRGLYTNEAIISRGFASENNLSVGDSLWLEFGANPIRFWVLDIAENRGIFFSTDGIFLSNMAIPRIIPLMSSQVITHAFISLHPNSPLSTQQVITQIEIASNPELAYPEPPALPPLQVTKSFVLEDFDYTSRFARTSFYIISVIVIFLCIVAIAALKKNSYNKDKKNFEVLYSLGAKKKSLVAIALLSTLLISLLAIPLTIGFGFLISAIASATSPLLSGFTIKAWHYAVSLTLAAVAVFIFSVIPILFDNRVKKPLKKGMQKKAIKIILSVFFAVAVTLLIIGIIFMNQLPIMGFIFVLSSLVYILMMVAKMLQFLFSLLARKIKRLFILRLSSNFKEKDTKRFFVFSILAAIVASLTVTIAINSSVSARPREIPFDFVIAGVRNPSQGLFDDIVGIDGVEAATIGNFRHGGNFTSRRGRFSSALITVSDNSQVNIVLSSMNLKPCNNAQTVIGHRLALNTGLRVGDSFVFNECPDNSTELVVDKIVNTNYLHGLFVISSAAERVDKQNFSTIFIVGDSGLQRQLMSRISFNGVVVTREYFSLVVEGLLGGLNNALFVVIFIILALVVFTSLFLFTLRLSSIRKQFKVFGMLGWSIKKEVGFNALSMLLLAAVKTIAAFALASAILLLTIPLFYFMGLAFSIVFTPWHILVSVIVSQLLLFN